LTLDLAHKNEFEEDKQKIGLCTHDDFSQFVPGNSQDVESSVCDFDAGNQENNPEGYHKAFEGENDVAFVCNSCHAILCKDCVQDYSSEDSPTN
jgi:hypothetical protein